MIAHHFRLRLATAAILCCSLAACSGRDDEPSEGGDGLNGGDAEVVETDAFQTHPDTDVTGPGLDATGGDAAKNAGDVLDATESDTGMDANGGSKGVGAFYRAANELRQALRSSPDHLPARADRLVAAEEPEAIFNFVRDEIAVVPNDGRAMTNLVTRVRWGARVTLRSGMGTVREKAELLAELFERAGLQAEVVGPWNGSSLTEQKLERILWNPVERDFQLDASRERRKRWHRLFESDKTAGDRTSTPDAGLGRTDSTTSSIPSRAERLGNRLREQLPNHLVSTEPQTFDPESGLPLVRVETDGGSRVVNPHYPEASFEEDFSTGSLAEAPEASGMLPVEISVSYARGGSPQTWTTAVEGKWEASQVVGRRIHLSFAPRVNYSALASMKVGDVGFWTPSLLVSGAELEADRRAELSEVGTPFMLGGEEAEFDRDSGEEFEIGGRTVDSTPSSGNPSEVESLDLHVDAAQYPCVGLNVEAEKKSGETVSGLSRGRFTIRDSERRQTATMLQNRGEPHRILFVLDTSGGVPEEFRSDGTIRTISSLAGAVAHQHPSASFGVRSRTQLAGDETGLTWKRDMAELRQQGRAALEEGSGGASLVETLAAASSLGATAAVIVAGSDEQGTLEGDQKEKVRGGPPALIVSEPGSKNETSETVAKLSGGRLLNIENFEVVERPLLRLAGSLGGRNYRFAYYAPLEGTRTRNVTVEFDDGRLQATGQYEVPRPSERSGCPGDISRLRTRVTVGDRTVERIIGGATSSAELSASAESAEWDALSTMLSTTIFAFEGPMPPDGVWLAEWLDAYLSRETVGRSVATGDPREIAGSLGADAGRPLPSVFFLGNAPPPKRTGPDRRTYPTGLRSAMFTRATKRGGHAFRHEFERLTSGSIETVVAPEGRPRLEPEGRWTFEETLRDSSTHQRDLEASRVRLSFESGKEGETALELAGDNYFFVPGLEVSEKGAHEDLGICAWVETTSAAQTLFSWGIQSLAYLEINDRGRIEWILTDTEGRTELVRGESRIDDGSWHQVCATFDGRTGRGAIFVDGEIDAERRIHGADSALGDGSERQAMVGSWSVSTEEGERGHSRESWNFRGRLDDLRVYDESLTVGQVAQHFRNEPVRRASFSADARRNLTQTVYSTVAEAAVFDRRGVTEEGRRRGKSTLFQLEGEPLRHLEPSAEPRDFDALFPRASSDIVDRWGRAADDFRDGWHLLVPDDGRPVAFWAVDAETAAARGVVGDDAEGVLNVDICESRSFETHDRGSLALSLPTWVPESGLVHGMARATDWLQSLETTTGAPPVDARIRALSAGGHDDRVVRAVALQSQCTPSVPVLGELVGESGTVVDSTRELLEGNGDADRAVCPGLFSKLDPC